MSYKPIHDIPELFTFFSSILGGKIIIVFILTLFASLAESFGMLMLIPLFQVLDDSGQVQTDGLARWIHQFLVIFGLDGSIWALVTLIAISFLFKGLLLFASLGYNSYLRSLLMKDVRIRLFDGYRCMTYKYYASRDTGHFINITNEQVNQLNYTFFFFLALGSQFVMSVAYAVMATMVSWQFGLMAFVLGIVLQYIFKSINRYVRQLSRKTAFESGELAKLLIQFFHGFKFLIATDQAENLERKVKYSVQNLTDYEYKTGMADGISSALREPIVVTLIMGIVLVQMTIMKQPVAPILVSIALFYRGLTASLAIQKMWLGTLKSIGSVELIRDELNTLQSNREKNEGQPIKSFNKGIKFCDVSFGYDKSLGNVLQDISLDIPVRSSIALVGQSGAGKSTLVDLITLMLLPSNGEIYIDDTSSKDISPASWRKQIGFVSQESVIFNDSIANNICMWVGDPVIDVKLMSQIQDAARDASLSDYIESLPNGYFTQVGDRGIRLSGGQRQRLFIARELFRKPDLLILDEATSALDSASELAIQSSIDSLKGKLTLIIIAHRLSTLRNVDVIYVIQDGNIVEKGSYKYLIADQSSRFSKFAKMQSL